MSMGAVLSVDCERARARASLAIDGELSQIELAHQRAHVGRCADCAEFERGLDVLTQELRTTPLRRPTRAVLPERRRNTGRRVLQAGAFAAAIVLAAALGSVAGSLSSHGQTRAAGPSLGRVASLSKLPIARPGARLQQRIAL